MVTTPTSNKQFTKDETETNFRKKKAAEIKKT